jgi:hypothetical protein
MIGLRAATCALLLVAGCGGKSLLPPPDAGSDHPATSIGCLCTADSQTLTLSWACYCQTHACNQVEEISNCSQTTGVWTRGCGFDEYTVDTPGGPEIWVYDQTGKLVGAQLTTDDSVFVCPDNHGIQRFVMRAGQFRPDSCNGVITCNCADTDASPRAICIVDGGFQSL